MKPPDEEMHKMTIICKVALQTDGLQKGRCAKFSLRRIGREEFGLSKHQVLLCTARARGLLDEFHGPTSDEYARSLFKVIKTAA